MPAKLSQRSTGRPPAVDSSSRGNEASSKGLVPAVLSSALVQPSRSASADAESPLAPKTISHTSLWEFPSPSKAAQGNGQQIAATSMLGKRPFIRPRILTRSGLGTSSESPPARRHPAGNADPSLTSSARSNMPPRYHLRHSGRGLQRNRVGESMRSGSSMKKGAMSDCQLRSMGPVSLLTGLRGSQG